MSTKPVFLSVCVFALTLLAPHGMAQTIAEGGQADRQPILVDRFGEDDLFALMDPIIFNAPLGFGTFETLGQSLESILQLSPSYAPVSGLPDGVWRQRGCNDCHQWSRLSLCAQANVYVDADPVSYQRKLHPFGGTFKMSLRHWALGGCL